MEYLWRKRGRFYFQIAVPADLQSLFDGRKVVQTALGTADLREARRKRDELLGEWRARFRRARERKPPTPAEIDTLARSALRRTYEATARGYLSLSRPLGEIVADLHDELDGDGYQLVPDDDGPLAEGPTPERKQAQDALAALGAEPTPEAIEAVRQALVRAKIAALESFAAGLEPPLPDKPATAVRGRRRQGGGISFQEAAGRYVTDRMRDPAAAWTAQTRVQNEATYRLFGDFTGGAALAAVAREDVSGFLDTIAGLHPDYGRSKRAKGLMLAELLDRYPGPPGLGNKTLNRHAAALHGLFRWARKAGLIEGENPAADHARPTGNESWLPFTVDELNALFKGSAFTVKPNRHTVGSARPWVMAVALFSGLREGEICALDAEDVHEQDGVSYFDVTASKSEAGVRRVPVHSELVRLGWLDYVKAIGAGPLFPGVAPGGPDQKRSHTFAKRFPAYRRQRGATRKRTAFHSFRKNFVRGLETAGVDRDRAALVVGHERGFTFRVYNPEGLDVAMLRGVVEAVRYPGLKV